MSETVAALMQQSVHCVDMDDTVEQVERQFEAHHLSWAPVLESGRAIVGVISATDLLQFRAHGLGDSTTPAWRRCTYKPIVVGPDAALADVARQMVERRIHHVVVMDADRIAGVVSALDFVRAFACAR
jgi:predicted transcriptional regulator